MAPGRGGVVGEVGVHRREEQEEGRKRTSRVGSDRIGPSEAHVTGLVGAGRAGRLVSQSVGGEG